MFPVQKKTECNKAAFSLSSNYTFNKGCLSFQHVNILRRRCDNLLMMTMSSSFKTRETETSPCGSLFGKTAVLKIKKKVFMLIIFYIYIRTTRG